MLARSKELSEIIATLVDSPTEENTLNYLMFVNETELFLLDESETFPLKSQEYFNKRREAFSYRRNSASILISKWVEKYKTTKDCPVSYADTLNIPFQKITPAK
jgi:hypothetical protein